MNCPCRIKIAGCLRTMAAALEMQAAVNEIQNKRPEIEMKKRTLDKKKKKKQQQNNRKKKYRGAWMDYKGDVEYTAVPPPHKDINYIFFASTGEQKYRRTKGFRPRSLSCFPEHRQLLGNFQALFTATAIRNLSSDDCFVRPRGGSSRERVDEESERKGLVSLLRMARVKGNVKLEEVCLGTG